MGLLTAAALVEFLLLRVVNRATGHLPGGLQAVASGLVFAGTGAYNLAYLSAAVLLGILGWLLRGQDRILSSLLIAWVASLFAAQALGSTLVASKVGAVSVAGVLLVYFLFRSLRTRIVRVPSALGRFAPSVGRAFPILIVAVFLSALFLHAGDALSASGLGVPARVEVFAAAEVLGIAAAFLAPLYIGGPVRRASLVTAALAVGVLAVPLAVRPDIVPLISFWSLGFQMSLPMPLYVGAASCLAYALAQAYQDRRGTGYLVHGLLLALLAGRMLADLYLVQLALVGVLFLTISKPFPEAAPHPSAAIPAAA